MLANPPEPLSALLIKLQGFLSFSATVNLAPQIQPPHVRQLLMLSISYVFNAYIVR